jgi:hypothetical protein
MDSLLFGVVTNGQPEMQQGGQTAVGAFDTGDLEIKVRHDESSPGKGFANRFFHEA